MPFRTSVVILNWNTREFLQQFLPDVIKFSRDQANIVVIDNASTDDSVSFLKNNFPEVRIIQNIKNQLKPPNNFGLASQKIFHGKKSGIAF